MTCAPLPLIPWNKSLLLSSRLSSDSYTSVQRTAIDIFALGYPEYANRLISALWEYGHGFEFDYVYAQDTLRCLYNAWDVTDTTPSFIQNPSSEKIFNGRTSDKANSEWQRVVVEGWTKGLPKDIKERILKGSLRNEDLDASKQSLRALSDDETPVSPTKHLTLAAVVEVAMLVGREDVAKELVKNEMVELYRQLREKCSDLYEGEYELRKWQNGYLGLSYSPHIWEILKDGPIGKILQVDELALEQFVQEGCELIKKRFTQGPERPHADKSIQELLQIIDENYIAARKLDPDSGIAMSTAGKAPATFLRPGATDVQIEELEKWLSQTSAPDAEDDRPMLPNGALPDDYKEFLRISDGIFPESNSQSGLLYGHAEVGTDDCAFLHEETMDLNFSLFPRAYTSRKGIDNIALGHFDCLTIGIGGDEGTVILIPPTSVKPALEAFEAAYNAASEKNKRLYERAALDLYGGMDETKKLEWLCIKWEHWKTEQQTWGGFRAHLEYCTDVAVEERKNQEKKAKTKEQGRGREEDIGQSDEEKGEKRKCDNSNIEKPDKAMKFGTVKS